MLFPSLFTFIILLISTGTAISVLSQKATRTANEIAVAPSVSPTPAQVNPSAEATPTPPSVKSKIALPQAIIDCIGPDGKHARSSQKDCDALNAFWKPTPTPVPLNTKTGSIVYGLNEKTGTPNVPFPSAGNQNNPLLTTPTAQPTSNSSGTITVDTTSVNITLSRTNAQYGLVYGSGFTVTSQGATGFQVHYNEPTQGQGFSTSSGGMTAGSSSTIKSYINVNKSNGIYTGSAVIEYMKDGSWLAGPTVSYSITLTN